MKFESIDDSIFLKVSKKKFFPYFICLILKVLLFHTQEKSKYNVIN